MVRRKRKDRPGLGYLLRLEWSPEVVVAYFVGWVVGYVGRLWSVTLARWFRASAGKRPKAGRFPPNTPPALSTGPHPPYPTRYDKGHTRDGQHPPPPSNATDKRRDIPTHPPQPKSPRWNATPGPNSASPVPLVAASSPQRGPRQPTDPGPTPATELPELEPDPGTQLSQSRAPRRRLVTPAGTAPTHRSRTNPGHRTDRAGTRPRDPTQPVPCPSSPPRHPSGDGANPPIPDQPRPPNGPSWNPTPGPNSASPVPLVAACPPRRGRRQPTDPGPTPATERTELEPDPGTQPSQPRAPRRRLVTPAGTAPTHRSRTNPGHRTDRAGTRPRDPTQPVPCPSSPPVAPVGTAPTPRSRTNPGHRTDRAGTRPRDPIQPAPCPSSPPRHPSGDRANPPIPDQPGHRTARTGTPRRDPTQQPPELPPWHRYPAR